MAFQYRMSSYICAWGEYEPLDARFRINGMLDSLAAMVGRRSHEIWL